MRSARTLRTTRSVTMKKYIASLNKRVDSMAEDLTEVVERTQEIPVINERLEQLDDHAGI